jgi:uncharacterized protein YcfL
MKIKSLVPLACAVATLFATGCITTVNTVENAQKEGQRTLLADKRIITDSDLNRRVGVVGINSVMTVGGLLRVQVELYNATGSLHRVSYQFEWFDANGMQVNNVLSASSVEQLEGKESKFISSIAPNPGCKDFRLKLISAD